MPSRMYQNKYLFTFEALRTLLKANVQMNYKNHPKVLPPSTNERERSEVPPPPE